MTQELATTQDFRPLPIPAQLQEVGLSIVEDAKSGTRAIVIPPEVRERVNVIDPVTSLVQSDPNWSPRISLVTLDADAKAGKHFYEQAGKKLAPTKQALEVLSKAAGILYTKTARIPRAELDAGEVGYQATLGIRRSDGTVEEIQREKVWAEDAERSEIEDAVSRAEAWENGHKTGQPKFGHRGEPSWAAEVEKRWIKEKKDRYAKTESKAVLRAIRAALQIPHTFTSQEAAKPFLVIGFNYTPDYTDAEVRKIVAAVALNARATMYGPSAARELTSGPPTDATPEPSIKGDSGGGQQAEEVAEGRPAGNGQEQAEAETGPDTPSASSSVPDSEPEPSLEQEPAKPVASFQAPPDIAGVAAEIARVSAVKIPAESDESAGLTLQEVKEKGGVGERWIAWQLKTRKFDSIADDVERFVELVMPDLWKRYQDDKAKAEASAA
jgi:hypothetical protein